MSESKVISYCGPPALEPRHRNRASWQGQLINSIRDIRELAACVDLDLSMLVGSDAAVRDFPLLVPRSYVEKIEPGNPRDPLLLQVLPSAAEIREIAGFVEDPVGDIEASISPGFMRKYAGRVLLVAATACAINCRYCFRRHYPYRKNHLDSDAMRRALQHIARDKTITEVIISGGEPLLHRDAALKALFTQLETISHVRTIRIHTRMLSIIPERLTTALQALFVSFGGQLVVVFHVNHPREIDARFTSMAARLRTNGIHLLNQSVLLAGVNDSVETLVSLSQSLFASGVMPYYLHMLDRVRGAAHFDVDVTTARGLIDELRSRLPGYLVPRLVREIAGENAKTPL